MIINYTLAGLVLAAALYAMYKMGRRATGLPGPPSATAATRGNIMTDDRIKTIKARSFEFVDKVSELLEGERCESCSTQQRTLYDVSTEISKESARFVKDIAEA
jgi:hypothetical protein